MRKRWMSALPHGAVIALAFQWRRFWSGMGAWDAAPLHPVGRIIPVCRGERGGRGRTVDSTNSTRGHSALIPTEFQTLVRFSLPPYPARCHYPSPPRAPTESTRKLWALVDPGDIWSVGTTRGPGNGGHPAPAPIRDGEHTTPLPPLPAGAAGERGDAAVAADGAAAAAGERGVSRGARATRPRKAAIASRRRRNSARRVGVLSRGAVAVAAMFGARLGGGAVSGAGAAT